jgi:Asp-tRNA(Asn)/Glu-tRNA(Gln) amidotransferase A subunit family amidase
MDTDDIGFLGVRELHALYRARKLSPVEVTQAVLARMAARPARWKACPSPSRTSSTPAAGARISARP